LRLRRAAWWWLIEKEARELLASRSWWILLVAMGPLVGFAFIGSVRTYAEASGLNGTSVGVGEAFSPLIGIWAPTFSACELAAVFLLPFVAIRVVGGDRLSGALKLESQQPLPPAVRVTAKALVLLAGWLIASVPAAATIVLWRSFGGSVYWPEVLAVAAGHLMNAGLTIALAAATASMTEHPSTAAILTLSVTVSTWILSFIAGVQGGIWEQLARYTPTAMVGEFQHGLIRLDVVIASVTLIAVGLGLAALWTRLDASIARQLRDSIAIAAAATIAIAAGAASTTSWDLSESRANSFSRADEHALAAIHEPMSIEVHLAPEDPRRVDFDRNVVAKLRRVKPDVQVRYVSATSIGLFEQTSTGYGEIWYDVGGRKAVGRAVTAEAALEMMYSLAGVTTSLAEDEGVFRGHPLITRAPGAALMFYVIWPALVVSGAVLARG
jgi:hypothetical protein